MLNWVNAIERFNKINNMIEENNEYFKSLVGNEYYVNSSLETIRIIEFDSKTLKFKIDSEYTHIVWWDYAYDILNNIIAKQYLYNIDF